MRWGAKWAGGPGKNRRGSDNIGCGDESRDGQNDRLAVDYSGSGHQNTSAGLLGNWLPDSIEPQQPVREAGRTEKGASPCEFRYREEADEKKKGY